MLLCEDTSIRQFGQMIAEALNKGNFKSVDEKIAFIERIIKDINQYCGITTKTNQLSKEAINILNNGNAFNVLSQIISKYIS